jgi:hypothetical protein
MMPTTGAYEFKPANQEALIVGDVTSPDMLPPGTWAWVDRSEPDERFLAIYMTCPDCKGLASLGWKRGDKPWQGHGIDAQGNISPSVLHTWKYGDPPVEQCGFHTEPTKLLGFVDKR